MPELEIIAPIPSDDFPAHASDVVVEGGWFATITSPTGESYPVPLDELRGLLNPNALTGAADPRAVPVVEGKEGQEYYRLGAGQAVEAFEMQSGSWKQLWKIGRTAVTDDGAAPNAVPTVTLNVSRAALTLGQSLTLTATAADSDGTISSVRFYEGATLLQTLTAEPYLLEVTPSSAGEKNYTAVAYDNTGAGRTSAPQRVQVQAVGNQNPIIAAFASVSTIVAGQQVTFSATANDPDGSINRVEFYDGPTLLGSDPTDPYSVTFAPTAPAARQLFAKAIDNAGGSTTTAAIPLTVTASSGNAAPTVTLSASPSTVQVGNTVTLTATANDSDGVVAKVEYFNGSTKLGETTSTPHSFTTQPIATAGTNFFSAKATDNAGASGLSATIFVLAQEAPVQNTTPAAPTFSGFSDTQEGGTVTLVPASGIPLADYRVSLPGSTSFATVSDPAISVGNVAGTVRAYSVAATGRNQSPTGTSQAFTAYTPPVTPTFNTTYNPGENISTATYNGAPGTQLLLNLPLSSNPDPNPATMTVYAPDGTTQVGNLDFSGFDTGVQFGFVLNGTTYISTLINGDRILS